MRIRPRISDQPYNDKFALIDSDGPGASYRRAIRGAYAVMEKRRIDPLAPLNYIRRDGAYWEFGTIVQAYLVKYEAWPPDPDRDRDIITQAYDIACDVIGLLTPPFSSWL